MQRALSPLLVAVILVTAGCAGLPGGGQGTQSTTDGATTARTPTTTATPTPSFESLSYPDGTSADGFDDVSAVTQAGYRLLEATSFRVDYEETRTRPDGTEQTTTLAGVQNGSRGVTTYYTEEDASQRTDIYTDGGTTTFWARGDWGASVEYTDSEMSRGTSVDFNLLVVATLQPRYLGGFEYEASDTYTRDGHRFVVYESTGVNESFAEKSSNPTFVGGNLTVTLRDDGLVTAIDGTLEREGEEGVVERTVRYRVEDVGNTTVEEPDWVDEEVPQLEMTLLEDGSVLEVTHVGGPALEDATVGLRRTPASGSVTVDSLEAGDSIYLTATERADENAIDVSASADRPSPSGSAVDFTDGELVTLSVESGDYIARLVVHDNASATGA